MSYIGNLEVILRDFLILVQQVKNEKVLETSARLVLILINEAQRDITMETLRNKEKRSIKSSNYIKNEMQNCQTTAGVWGKATNWTHKKLQSLIQFKAGRNNFAKNLIV